MNLLLIEDNDTLAKSLSYSLEQEGFQVHIKDNLKDAKHFLEITKISLIILDITLPDGNGFTFYEQTIAPQKIPTLILTAKDEEENIVKGLELGVEDYITKPFFIKELILRIHKILKSQNTIRTVKDISFDLEKMEVYKHHQKLKLTSLELRILHLLFSNCNKVVTRAYIIDKIWEWTGNDVYDNTVTVYLKRIREKLNSDIIVTIKGIGYRIDSL